ncbi:hypothetical protein D1007_28980 [Hordeum vulgare]|nr:hypothetical protein D1007_28980 [Hordeum vulgare]
MISKLNKPEWLEGTFMETVKMWQQDWFYITKPHVKDQAALPPFIGLPPKKKWASQAENMNCPMPLPEGSISLELHALLPDAPSKFLAKAKIESRRK